MGCGPNIITKKNDELNKELRNFEEISINLNDMNINFSQDGIWRSN